MFAKRLLKLFVFVFAFRGGVTVFAQDLNFEIVPEASGDPIVDVKKVAESPGEVMDTYKDIAQQEDRTLGDKLASGIMDWETILDYVVYLVKFLSQLGLLIGACMFIYAGYMYASQILGGDENKGKNAMKNAIIGVLVLSFSYAILKIVTNMFIE